jgi:hypothetical protein
MIGLSSFGMCRQTRQCLKAFTCYYLGQGCLGNVEFILLGWIMKRFHPLMPWLLKVSLHNSPGVEKVQGY